MVFYQNFHHLRDFDISGLSRARVLVLSIWSIGRIYWSFQPFGLRLGFWHPSLAVLEDLWSSLEVHPTHCMRGVYLDQFLVCLFQRIFSFSYYGLLGTLAFTLTLSSFWQGRYYRCASKFMREATNLIKVFS